MGADPGFLESPNDIRSCTPRYLTSSSGINTVREGWELFRIRGIPLRIHPTWFVILLLATLAFQDQYRSQIQLSASLGDAGVWLIAFLTALLLFVSVLLHELGHSLTALSQGVQVRDITLFLLGGVASVERECPTARGALLVAMAGPAVSLILGFLLLSLTHRLDHLSMAIGAMANQLGILNLVLRWPMPAVACWL
jgi:Zn-dependent protease